MDRQILALLHTVQRPGRYAGGEWNAVRKEPGPGTLSVALCASQVYEGAMSSLECQALYQALNASPGIACERVFLPWPDMAQALRSGGLPLFGLESGRPLAGFDVVLVAFGRAGEYPNILTCLELGGVPLHAAARDERHPVVVAAGSRLLNPEPLAPFLDLVLLGEPQEPVLELAALALEMAGRGGGLRSQKQAFLKEAARLGGAYVPGWYRSEPDPGGVRPRCQLAPCQVQAGRAERLGAAWMRPVVPYLEVANDRGLVEVQRSCGGFCRGCASGGGCEHLRERSAAEVAEIAGELARTCGYREFALLGPDAADYGPWVEPVRLLRAKLPSPEHTFTVPPLAWDAPQRGLGAEEGLGQRLANSAAALCRLGVTSFRIRCALGRPGDGVREVEWAVETAARIDEAGSKVLERRPRVRVEAQPFAPRPHLPGERSPIASREDAQRLAGMLRKGLRRLGVQALTGDYDAALFETAMALGDRRAAAAVEEAWRAGCRLESWGQPFDAPRWAAAFRQAGIDPAAYASRTRPKDEVLPWARIVAPGASASPVAQPFGECVEQPCPICQQGARAS